MSLLFRYDPSSTSEGTCGPAAGAGFGSSLAPRQSPGPRENLREAIRVAVTFSNEDEYITSGGGARYARGLTAYKVWADDLENEARFDTRQAILHHWSVNCFCYDALLDARLAAAEYLKRHTADADTQAQPDIAAAAELYAKIAQVLQEGRKTCVPTYTDGQEPGAWTPQQRAGERPCSQCRSLDQTALQRLATAAGNMR